MDAQGSPEGYKLKRDAPEVSTPTKATKSPKTAVRPVSRSLSRNLVRNNDEIQEGYLGVGVR